MDNSRTRSPASICELATWGATASGAMMGPTTDEDSRPETAVVAGLAPSAPASKVTWVCTPSGLAAGAAGITAAGGADAATTGATTAAAGAALVLVMATGAGVRLATERRPMASDGAVALAVAAAGAAGAASASPGLRRALLASKMMRMGPAAWRLARSMAAAASAAAFGLAGV